MATYVELAYHYENQPFHRIRRITGYLVGTLDRFNNAKRAEERDRVKHSIRCNNAFSLARTGKMLYDCRGF